MPQDDLRAKEWYEKAAKAGESEAMTNLGYMYDQGQGVPRDYDKAKDWYEMAAAAGDAVAMRNLGILYHKGQGVLQDDHQAREWIEKAAAAGDAESQEALKTLPSAQPSPQAQSHYDLAVAADHQGDVDKAIAEYRKALAADPNFAAAHYHLGRILKDVGQEQAAGEEFAAACALEPTNPQVCRK